MLLTAHFLVNFFCGFFPCFAPYEEPSDPLQLGRRSGRNYDVLDPEPVVHTRSGTVRGYVTHTILGRPIYTFEGIPYAENPGGRNRFKSPVPKYPWRGVRDAKKPGAPCLQLHTLRLGTLIGHEDCLFLNIYTVQLPGSNDTQQHELPVIVWLHGGGFHFGAGNEYGPAYLLDHDMILVTINYRLGIYGFLSTLDSASPGNYGLKDQALALKWVHENIHSFGGNASLVTLMGQSAGASATHLHMISKRSRPYFNAGIAFSGVALSSWAVLKERHVHVMNSKIANNTRCPLKPSSSFMNCLRAMNPYDLARREAFLADWAQWPVILLGPVVEPPSPDAFLTEFPKDVYKRGDVAKHPLILSITADEGDQASIFLDGLLMFRRFARKWKERAPLFLDYNYLVPPEQYNGITNRISKFYFGSRDPRSINSRVYGRMTTDALFYYPMHKSIQAHSEIAPTYGTVFGFKGTYGFGSLFGFQQTDYGVAHTDDIWFYMNSTTYLPGFKTSDPDYDMVKFMTYWIYQFASTRIPTLLDQNGGSHMSTTWTWVQDPQSIDLLIVRNDTRVIPEPRVQVLKFWESLGIFD